MVRIAADRSEPTRRIGFDCVLKRSLRATSLWRRRKCAFPQHGAASGEDNAASRPPISHMRSRGCRRRPRLVRRLAGARCGIHSGPLLSRASVLVAGVGSGIAAQWLACPSFLPAAVRADRTPFRLGVPATPVLEIMPQNPPEPRSQLVGPLAVEASDVLLRFKRSFLNQIRAAAFSPELLGKVLIRDGQKTARIRPPDTRPRATASPC